MKIIREADIEDLLAKLTLEEKASLCSGSDFWHTQPVERLGIDAVMVTDGPHGLRKQAGHSDHLGLNESVPATCFPAAVGLGSTWDTALLRRVGEALGVETRSNEVAVLLGPGVNMKRSPLCGRNFEYFSEDPLLAGELAAALVEGVQSQGVGTSLKHFAVNNQETDRMRVDAQVDERTLREIYLPAFERVVKQARPLTVMCAYNKINGTFGSEHPWLLTTVLRDEWGFDGLVMSDWGAVEDRVAGVSAGLDLEMPASGGTNDQRVLDAVRDGRLPEADLDVAVVNFLTLLARTMPAVADPGDFSAADHHALAREAAARAAVLLKNANGALPLTSLNDVVVIGEMARTPRYQGAGSSQVNPTQLDNALDALRSHHELEFAPGYLLAEAAGEPGQDRTDEQLRSEAVELARGKTAVVFCGLPAIEESEGYDRQHMSLPQSHRDLIAAVGGVASSVIVTLSNGAATTMSDWQDSADAVLELWLGGQAGGSAAAELLLGQVSPSGRLAESIALSIDDVPAQLNFPGERGVVRYGEGRHIGYRGLDAMDVEVSYPFGHGLTYTTFDYGSLEVSATAITEDTFQDEAVFTIDATVTNSGDATGTAVPQLYIGFPDAKVPRVPRELRGFTTAELQPGESRQISFTLDRRDLSYWDTGLHSWQVEPGAVDIWVGESSRDLRLHQAVQVEAPQVFLPLHAHSTVQEWLDHPRGRDVLEPVMRPFLENAGDESEAAFYRDMPLVKVTLLAPATLSPAKLDELLEAVRT